MTITLWHNPRCSKSRQALEMLQQKGLSPDIRRYLDNPPDAAELQAAQKALGLPLIEMMRSKDALFKELGLAKDDPEENLLAAMAANPKLIERPVLFTDKGARIGRPTEALLDIL